MDRWPNCAFDLLGGEETIGAREGPEHRADERRGTTGLIQ
jgi:hypothetical protein